MRIEAYTQVQQLYNTNKARKTEKTSTVSRKDQLEISSFGKELQAAKAAITAAPDVREDITAPIKTSIQNGTYSVSDDSFAEKLLAKYNGI